MSSPATPAEIIAACRDHGAKRPVAMWLACHLLRDLSPGRLESEFHAEFVVIDFQRARLDLAHARGKIATPAEVWREIAGGVE